MKFKILLLPLFALSTSVFSDNSYYQFSYDYLKPIKVESREGAEHTYRLYSALETELRVVNVNMKQNTYLKTLEYKSSTCMELTYRKLLIDYVELNKEYLDEGTINANERSKKDFKNISNQNGYNCQSNEKLLQKEKYK